MADCPECRRNEILASQMRALADAMLIPVARATGLPPEVVQAFVEGSSVGAVQSARAKKGKKVSAYNRAYKNAFKRVSSRYKNKNGTWRKDGFKRAVREAHKIAKAGKK